MASEAQKSTFNPVDPALKARQAAGGQKKQRVTVMNQTNGGMQPWHKMMKPGAVAAQEDDFDDGIFNRH